MTVPSERPSVTFADVAGVDEAVDELREVRDFLRDPQPFRSLGARLPKGVLLHGPPGTGKTLLARALAGETNAAFYSISAAGFVEMYVGVGAARVRDLFEEAKKTQPAIIFVDELDAVGRQRTGGGLAVNEEREATLNQLLIEMDGFDAGTGVLVVGATNRLDVIDAALLRSGRFDRRITVELPDARGRELILKVHTRDKPLAAGISLTAIARKTAGLSGADLANVANEAALLAGRERSRSITLEHFSEAIERVMAGPARRSRVLTSAERKRIACHEAGHGIAAAALPGADTVGKISIVARGRAGGLTWFVPEEEQVLYTRSQLLDRISALLAGKISEELVLGEHSSGGNDDLQKASDLARHMVMRLGMNTSAGMAVPPGDGHTGPAMSESMAARVDSEVEAILLEAQGRVTTLLKANRRQLVRLLNLLLKKETLEGDELDAMLSTVIPAESSRGSAASAKPFDAGPRRKLARPRRSSSK